MLTTRSGPPAFRTYWVCTSDTYGFRQQDNTIGAARGRLSGPLLPEGVCMRSWALPLAPFLTVHSPPSDNFCPPRFSACNVARTAPLEPESTLHFLHCTIPRKIAAGVSFARDCVAGRGSVPSPRNSRPQVLIGIALVLRVRTFSTGENTRCRSVRSCAPPHFFAQRPTQSLVIFLDKDSAGNND